MSNWVAPSDGEAELGGGKGSKNLNGEKNECHAAALPVPVACPTSETAAKSTSVLPAPVVRPTSETDVEEEGNESDAYMMLWAKDFGS
eukprot:5727743-Karenia_brevis.AAC.1